MSELITYILEVLESGNQQEIIELIKNLFYAFVAVVLVVIGLMIMFKRDLR